MSSGNAKVLFSGRVKPMSHQIWKSLTLVAFGATAFGVAGCIEEKDPWNDFPNYGAAPPALPGSEETKPVDMAKVPFEQKLALAREAVARKNIDRARDFFTAAVNESMAFGDADPRYFQALQEAAFFNYLNGAPPVGKEMFERLQRLRELALGSDAPEVGEDLQNLGNVYSFTGDREKAEAAFKRAIAVYEKFPPGIRLGLILKDYAVMLEKAGRLEEAKPISERSKKLLDRPDVPKE